MPGHTLCRPAKRNDLLRSGGARRRRTETGHFNPNWSFLVGSEEDTRTLAMLLGIKYSRNPISGDIMHDNKIVLLNGTGEITKELLGLDASIEDFR